ncbi:hypothetical protein [Elongatibacter sediminis]|uniref:Uncharacterized protein n=1 Tax=Elongatibacter sediminis TaxID=3119006 RepID=A0AAW9RDC1_9GAMM
MTRVSVLSALAILGFALSSPDLAQAESVFNKKEFNCGGDNATGYATCNKFVRSYGVNAFNYAVYGASAYKLDSVTLQVRFPGKNWVKMSRHTSNIADEKHGVIFTFNIGHVEDTLDTSAKYLRDNQGFEIRSKIESVAAGGSETRHHCAAVEVSYDKGGATGWRYRKAGSNDGYVKAESGNVFMWEAKGTSNRVRCSVRTGR